MIVIVDIGIANVGSVRNMLIRLGAEVEITNDKDAILSAKAIILPGVGSFDAGIKAIKALDCFVDLEHMVLKQKVPTLGICLGMQIMTKSSEEGHETGLGWVDAVTRKLSDRDGQIPNMGWRYVQYVNHKFLSPHAGANERFYFVHSYSVNCTNENIVAITSEGDHLVTAGYVSENIIGVQFHPEKSHINGFAFFKRWLAFNNLQCGAC